MFIGSFMTTDQKQQTFCIKYILLTTWARSCENVSYAICKQQRHRSACASAQSDQHLCCSLLRKYDMYTCNIQRFKILASFSTWAGWFECYLVENHRRHIFALCGSLSTKKLTGHIGFGLCASVRASVCPFVLLFDACHIWWTVPARVLKFHIWISHGKIVVSFFSCPSCLPFWSYAPLKKSE